MSEKSKEEIQRELEKLEDTLFAIAMQAHGHKKSTLYKNGSNVALANIVAIAANALDETEFFKNLE